VLIGPNASLQSVVLKNKSFVGMGSTLRSGVVLDSYGVIAAGAVVEENTHIKTN